MATGFAAMGLPIPFDRRQKAFDAAIEMGCSREEAFAVTDGMAEQLSRDKPFEALKIGTKYAGITAAYRLMAHLLT